MFFKSVPVLSLTPLFACSYYKICPSMFDALKSRYAYVLHTARWEGQGAREKPFAVLTAM